MNRLLLKHKVFASTVKIRVHSKELPISNCGAKHYKCLLDVHGGCLRCRMAIFSYGKSDKEKNRSSWVLSMVLQMFSSDRQRQNEWSSTKIGKLVTIIDESTQVLSAQR